MVAYSFKKQFAGPILDLSKPHTIRADRKRHARPGEEVQLYVGMRTKHCRLLGRATCAHVLPIVLHLAAGLVAIDGGRIEGASGLDAFAVSDGFRDWSAMLDFWQRQHAGVLVFEGVLIGWTDLRTTGRAGGGDRQMDMFAETAAP